MTETYSAVYFLDAMQLAHRPDAAAEMMYRMKRQAMEKLAEYIKDDQIYTVRMRTDRVREPGNYPMMFPVPGLRLRCSLEIGTATVMELQVMKPIDYGELSWVNLSATAVDETRQRVKRSRPVITVRAWFDASATLLMRVRAAGQRLVAAVEAEKGR